MKIDNHTHAWMPEALPSLDKGVKLLDGEGGRHGSPHNWSPRFTGTIENLLAAEKQAGIDRFVLLPVAGKPELCRTLTDWAADCADRYPEVIPFGAVHPRSADPKEDVTAVRNLGFKGVKLHSLVQQFNPVDDDSLRLVSLITDAGLVLLIDSMNLSGAVAVKPNLKPLMDTALAWGIETGPREIVTLARRFPALRIIAAHMGCLYGWDNLGKLLDLDQVYFDLAYVHRLLDPETVVKLIRQKGPERILFGSDAPYRHPSHALDWFLQLPLTDQEKDMILSRNLINLLNLYNEDSPGISRIA
jgi:uncharacterized protein